MGVRLRSVFVIETANETDLFAKTLKRLGRFSEDELAVLEVTAKTLKHAGCEVLPANTYEAAMAFVNRPDQTIHALLTAVRMPGHSGPELAKAVRSARPETKLLFASGYVDKQSQEQMGDEGALLRKPFTRRQLLDFLRTQLGSLVD